MSKCRFTTRRLLSMALGVLMIFSLTVTAMGASTIETKYAAAGSFAVTTTTATGIDNDTLVIYHPTNMTGSHPIITWGNGTFTNPTQYSKILSHISSYGFVIVCSYGSNQGKGTTMINAAQYMINENDNSSSKFYNKLDVNKIAAMGHSQGACGAVNVSTDPSFGSRIKTVVPISLVRPDTLRSLGVSCDVTKIGNKPTFLSCGTLELDSYASPKTVKTYYYDKMAAANLPVMMAARRYSGHNEIMDYDSPERFKGYLTAWLMYQLKDDTYARGAFAGATPEIKTNTSWSNVAINNLP